MREIQVRNNNNRCLLRFTYAGKSYSLTLGDFTSRADRKKAEQVANQIYLDCISGNFDPTLGKYDERKASKLAVIAPKVIAIGLESLEAFLQQKEQELEGKRSILEWRRFGLQIKEFGIPGNLGEAEKFILSLSGNWDKRVINLRSYGLYLVKNGLARNPFEGLKAPTRKGTQRRADAFTQEEVKLILNGFEVIQSKQSDYQHYLPFVKFLFLTGVRTSEAVGLKWKYVDFDTNQIEICETLVWNDITGKMTEKGTKTGVIRFIPMGTKLRQILLELKEKTNPKSKEDLVFTRPDGTHITRMFSTKIWKRVLNISGVPYRKMYCTRHTFVSTQLAHNIDPLTVAKVTGHSVDILLKHYAHLIRPPVIIEVF